MNLEELRQRDLRLFQLRAEVEAARRAASKAEGLAECAGFDLAALEAETRASDEYWNARNRFFDACWEAFGE